MAELVDRERELRELRDLVKESGPKLGLIYGRRRVGKTYLLSHTWADADTRVFYFLATDTTPEFNRRALLEELRRWSDREIIEEDYPTWRAVFRLLAELAADEPIIVVLDEFQFLTGTENSVPSQLNAVWDRLEDVEVKMVLSGSEVGTMEDLKSRDAALFGRFDWAARLRPFDYFDAAQMVPEYDRRRAIHTYAIFGGMPSFLDTIDDSRPLADNVIRRVLSPRGAVHLQLDTVIDQEKGIRKPGDHRAVLGALADGDHAVGDITSSVGLSKDSVRRILTTLQDLQLVRRDDNFDAGRTTPARYIIADNAVRFWHRFVQSNLSHLARDGGEAVWKDTIEPELNTYTGKVFEQVVAQGFDRMHESLGLASASRWHRWEGKDRGGNQIEIDIIAELSSGKLLTGEVKWSSSPVDVSLHTDLQQDLAALGNSGRGWARDALDPDGAAGHLYVSAAGFTDAFRSLADTSAGLPIYLLDLDDLFELAD